MQGIFNDAAWVQSYVAILAAILAVAGLFLNAFAIRAQVRNSRSEKQIDVIMECNRRYEVASARIRRAVSDFQESTQSGIATRPFNDVVDEPFRAYWLVFYEEWQFFGIGMVPKPFFRYWCTGLVRNFAAPSMEGFGQLSLLDAWEIFGKSTWGYTGPFVEHVDRLAEISKLPTVEWDKKVEAAVKNTSTRVRRERKTLGR